MYHHFRPFSCCRLACPEEFLLLCKEHNFFLEYVHDHTVLDIWRNDFAHEGKINTTATYEEAVQAYQDGKEIIHCLARCMNR